MSSSQASDSIVQKRLAAVAAARPPNRRIIPSLSEVRLAALHRRDGAHVALLSCREDAGVITIGRDARAVITLDDRHASRIHARIWWDDQRAMHVIVDGDSLNGTYVNGHRVTGVVGLIDGTRIRIGTSELLYRRDPI